MLTKSDFWPPVQGGWEQLHGTFVPVTDIVSAFALPPSHPDIVGAEDDSDICDVLEGLFHEKNLPPPERVIFMSRKRTKGDVPSRATDYHAYWPTDTWIAAPALAGSLKGCFCFGPTRLVYKYPRFVAAGADAIIWLLAVIGLVLWACFG